MDKAIDESNAVGENTQSIIGNIYYRAASPVLQRHKKTLDRIASYEEKGKTGLARALWRSSGLLDELAKALAEAGRQATEKIGEQRADILEVMAKDDGT